MMNKASIRWVAGAAAIAAGLLGPSVIGASAASAQAAPPTLTGEELTGGSGGGHGIDCADTGSFSFTVSGTATGPYSGTFTETGSGTVNSVNNLASFTATFTIDSAAGEVTGTNTLTSPVSGVACYQDPSDITFLFSPVGTAYQATIHTSQGNYSDQGTAQTSLYQSSGTVNLFDETFTSSQTQTTLIEPTSTAQCKNGGYKNFPQFKNQGQCVAYVKQHGGS